MENRSNNPTTTTLTQTDQQKDEYASHIGGMGKAEHDAYQRDFYLQELIALHEEINTRMSQRGNYFTFTIITAGSLLSLGATTSPQIALFYPVLSLFLAAAWSDEDGKIGALGAYLHDREVEYHLKGWSTFHRASKKRKPRAFFSGLDRMVPKSLLSIATRGVFLSTQAMAILVASLQFVGLQGTKGNNWLVNGPLLGVAALAMVCTLFVIRHQRNHHMVQEDKQ